MEIYTITAGSKLVRFQRFHQCILRILHSNPRWEQHAVSFASRRPAYASTGSWRYRDAIVYTELRRRTSSRYHCCRYGRLSGVGATSFSSLKPFYSQCSPTASAAAGVCAKFLCAPRYNKIRNAGTRRTACARDTAIAAASSSLDAAGDITVTERLEPNADEPYTSTKR